MSTVKEQMEQIGKQAKVASRVLAGASTAAKNKALIEGAKALRAQGAEILQANVMDMEAGRAKGLDAAMLDRLELSAKRIEAMAAGLEEIAKLPDPVGVELASWERPSGLEISRVSIPLGVIGIIYEARPNVTADAGGLCLKSGNAAILRGGSESFHSSAAIADCLHDGLIAAGLPVDAIQLVPMKDREAVGEMLRMSSYIDVIIPRGGKGLCERVMAESRVPTLLHLEGNCHTYIHEKANADMAVSVLHNAKLRRTGICGATETLVIDRAIAKSLLPRIVDDLTADGCQLRGDDEARKLDKRIGVATEEDWYTEFLAKILAIKVVANLAEGLEFISKHSSGHTDAIITEDGAAAEAFLSQIDSAIVMHNTSTQFADGGEFGMGAEIGIATGRLHARGPVGAQQLTTYKYRVRSNGSIRPV